MKTANLTTFPIESGIPVPDVGMRRPIKYPFRLLEVGQSFFVPKGKLPNIASCWNRCAPKKFTAKTFADGVRVWRIA